MNPKMEPPKHRRASTSIDISMKGISCGIYTRLPLMVAFWAMQKWKKNPNAAGLGFSGQIFQVKLQILKKKNASVAILTLIRCREGDSIFHHQSISSLRQCPVFDAFFHGWSRRHYDAWWCTCHPSISQLSVFSFSPIQWCTKERAIIHSGYACLSRWHMWHWRRRQARR